MPKPLNRYDIYLKSQKKKKKKNDEKLEKCLPLAEEISSTD